VPRLLLPQSAETQFPRTDNHYVELVWRRAASPDPNDNEGTLPMTLVSVFCSLVNRLPVARELGLRARPVGFPGTLLAMLRYEGEGEREGTDGQGVYVDVYSERILGVDVLRDMLQRMGQPPSDEFLQPATAREMVRPLLSGYPHLILHLLTDSATERWRARSASAWGATS